MTSQLTLICPTYKRHPFLIRSVRFWSQYNFNIVYADGSPYPCSFDFSLPDNVLYYHINGSIHERIEFLLSKVKTPYVCLMGDDEYYIPSALNTCTDFLDQNQDYISCMGRALGFTTIRSKLIYFNDYNFLEDLHLDSNSPLERLMKHFSAYTPAHCYAVTRFETFSFVMRTALSFSYDVYAIIELIEEFLAISQGKSIVLPILYWLRSHESLPIRNTGDLTLNTSKTFAKWWPNPKTNQETTAFCLALAKATHFELNQAQIESVFNIYFQQLPIDTPTLLNSGLTSIKFFLPSYIINLLRTLQFFTTRSKKFFISNKRQSDLALQFLVNQKVFIDFEALSACTYSISKCK